MRTRLFIDIQFMQTGAYDRGMGRYFYGLLKAVVAQADDAEIHCIYSTALEEKNIKSLRDTLRGVKHAENILYQALDLWVHDFGKDNYTEAYTHNRGIVTNYLRRQLTEAENTVWLIPCLMQEPAVPAYPDLPSITKAAVWHDLMPYLMHDHYFPDPKSAHARSYLSRLNLLLETDKVFTISQTTNNDLVEFLSIPERRTTIINASYNDSIIEADAAPQKLTKKPYFLCPASPEPNKNVALTIQGFARFNGAHGNRYSLVVTSDYNQKVAEEAARYTKDVVFSGHVSSAELKGLYEGSDGLLFASVYEGFGLPIVEAVNFSKKVICSDINVFREFEADDAFYWCDPTDPSSIAAALSAAVGTDGLSSVQRKIYFAITRKYTWDNSAKAFLKSIKDGEHMTVPKRTIAIVGPHPASFSSIGKFVAETVPYLVEQGEVHYYYDSGPSDERHGYVRFNYLEQYPLLYPVQNLLTSQVTYDKIIYHMGNSDHHMKSYLLAHTKPATMVLHDTDLGGKGLAGQMLSNGYLSLARKRLEDRLETEYLKQPERFVTSLISAQEKVITHSDFAHQVTHDYALGSKKSLVRSYHPVNTLMLPSRLPSDRPIKLGIAGIMSEVKGIDTLQWLMQETEELRGCELWIFGFGFFTDKAHLNKLAEKYDNIHTIFDLTDYRFKETLSSLDVLINYRPIYKGEASRATLEAMREGVIPIVRDIGWFGELPDATSYKLASIERLPELIKSWAGDPLATRRTFANMAAEGQKFLKNNFSFEGYIAELLK